MLSDDEMVDHLPSTVDKVFSHAIARRVVTLFCGLALLLLGLTVGAHSEPASAVVPYVVAAAGDDGDHCPGSAHTPGLGHCCSTSHSHTCCMLPVATGVVATATAPAWGRLPGKRSALILPAAIYRPPALLAA